MPRMILDGALQQWEAFATTGRYGFPDPARVIFRCVSDPEIRARAVDIEGDKSDAEKTVETFDDGELREMLAGAPELD